MNIYTLLIQSIRARWDWLVSCGNSSQFVESSRNNFDQALTNALADIKGELHPSATFVVVQPAQFTYLNYGYTTTIPQGTNRLSEIDAFMFDGIFGTGKRGLYVPESGRIFVRQTSWCLHTIIHETLHSVSTFAIHQNIKFGNRYPFLNEGMTEFLSGYILSRRYPDCYIFWKRRYPTVRCSSSIGYQRMARIWYTFCRFIPLDIVEKVFFNVNSLSWGTQLTTFLQDITNRGYTFSDPIRQVGGILEDRFLAECKRSFGEQQVDEIFELESSDFDFSRLAQ